MASSINASTSGAGGVITTADNTGVLNIQTASTTVVTVDTTQNVGIGTASPATKLHIISGPTVDPLRLQSTLSGFERAWTIGPNVGANGIFAIRDTTAGDNRLNIDTSGNLQFNSGYGSVATAYGCRAWVNFNGTGTVAIRGSANVTSITDNGVGDYTVNLTTAMPDANFSAIPQSGEVSGSDNNSNSRVLAMSTSTIRIGVKNSSFGFTDYNLISLAIFR